MTNDDIIAACRRTQEVRDRTGMSQSQMAARLGVTKDTYAKWENRSLIPSKHLADFVLVTGCDPVWLLTGRTIPMRYAN